MRNASSGLTPTSSRIRRWGQWLMIGVPRSVFVLCLLCVPGTTFNMLPAAVIAQGYPGLAHSQSRHPRVAAARREKDTLLRRQFRERELPYPPRRMHMRIFKEEGEIDIWVGNGARYALFKTYDICAGSGELGPKRREGDGQIPEGCYHVVRFNPYSSYHLSMGIDYPNASDRILSDRRHPGGDIYIHGSCVSIGCISVTDDAIKEIYWLALLARSNGDPAIQVHIFPARLGAERWKALRRAYENDSGLIAFWSSLKLVYDAFEEEKALPRISVGSTGYYRVVGR